MFKVLHEIFHVSCQSINIGKCVHIHMVGFYEHVQTICGNLAFVVMKFCMLNVH